jgi:hypothetical protein
MNFKYKHKYILTGIESVGYYDLIPYEEDIVDDFRDIIYIRGTLYTNEQPLDWLPPHNINGYFQDEEDGEWVRVVNGRAMANRKYWAKDLKELL